MKSYRFFLSVVLASVLIIVQGCKKDDLSTLVDNQNGGGETLGSNAFVTVYFGQTHLLRPEQESFKLISERDALVKVNITSAEYRYLTAIDAVLTLNGATETIALAPPTVALEPISLEPGLVEHSFSDSFTAVIPKEWIQPGLAVTITSEAKSVAYDSLRIGAPNTIIMNMFDTHFFQESPGDYPTGWKEELESKLPISEIELRRLPRIIFSELTVPPRRDVGAKAARVNSKEAYQELTGSNFDGEQAAAAQWNSALKAAAGVKGGYSLFYTNIYGVHAGGQAGGFAGVGNGTSLGILHHELGHALSLPHWGNKADYPYRGDMFGIPAPEVFNEVHVGPTWGVDLKKMRFIPPTVQTNSVGGDAGTYKKDPMQGGGSGDQEEGFLLRHFSDYSMRQIQNYLEGHITVWSPASGDYSKWDGNAMAYTKPVTNNGVQYSEAQNTEVISIMAGVSAVTPQATIVYPPIGPYLSGSITLFDPTNATDRQMADEIYCPDGGCDVSVRIVQGGQVKTFMLPLVMDYTADPLDGGSFNTKAINVSASDGNITTITLLLTPDVEKEGLQANPEVLYSWEN